MGTASSTSPIPQGSRRSLRHQFQPVRLGDDAFDPDGDEGHGHDDRGGERIRAASHLSIFRYRRHSFRDVRQARRLPATMTWPATAMASLKSARPSGKHIGHLQHGAVAQLALGVV